MAKELQNRFKRALITGGRSGIGQALLHWLESEGLQVKGTSRRASEDNGNLLYADFASREGVQEFLQQHRLWLSEVDLVVFNAGFAGYGFFPSQSTELMERQLQVMLGSVLMLSHELWPVLQQRSGSACVFIGSMAADFSIPGFSAYNAAKAGLDQFAESLLVESGSAGPQVVNCRLGDIRTGFNQQVDRVDSGSAPEKLAWMRIEEAMAVAPEPDLVVKRLRRILVKGRSGSWNIGSPVQCFWAPMAARILPRAWMRTLVRRYYNL